MSASRASSVFTGIPHASSAILSWCMAWYHWKFSSLSDESPSIYHISDTSNFVLNIFPPRGTFAPAYAFLISLQSTFSTWRNVGAEEITIESEYAKQNASAIRADIAVFHTPKHDFTATRWWVNTARMISSCFDQCHHPSIESKKTIGSFCIVSWNFSMLTVAINVKYPYLGSKKWVSESIWYRLSDGILSKGILPIWWLQSLRHFDYSG